MRLRKGVSPVWIAFGVVIVAVFLPISGLVAASDLPARSGAWADVTLMVGAPRLVEADSTQQALAVGQRLYAGSVLHTDGTSRLELTFPSGDMVRMAEETTIELGAKETEAEKPGSLFQVALIGGNVWVNLSGRFRVAGLQLLATGAVFNGTEGIFRATMFPEGDVEVKTYAGKITADGPFEIVKEDGHYTLRLVSKIEGEAIEPWRHQMEPYQKMIVLSSGEVTPPFRFAAKSDLNEWVRWNQQQDETER